MASRRRLASVSAATRLAPGETLRRWHGAAPAIASALLIVGAALPEPSVRDAVTGAAAEGVHVALPATYLLLAPFCAVADWMAELPLHRHYELMVCLLAAVALWPTPRRRGSLRDLACRVVRGIVAVPLVYAAAVLIPRPIPRLVARDPDVIVVDFHSHTSASHDGRAGFDAEANRAWHAAAGFDVAYVTDHGTLTAARAAAARNPRRAGDGVVLLPGIEQAVRGQHINLLGDPARVSDTSAAPRVALLTLPARLDAAAADASLSAVELSDASPRGLQQGDRERAAILALAARRNLAAVTGSNDHGWAINAVAWTLVRVPSWRDMTPETLDRAIRVALTTRRFDATRVVERRRLASSSGAPASIAGALAADWWALCRALSWPERLAWLAWLWAPALFARARRRSSITGVGS